MANIFDIKQDFIDIFNELEDNGGELTPELEEKLQVTQETFKDKIKSYSNVIKMLETDIKSIKEEKNRLNDLQKSKENTIERLKNIVVSAIEEFGDTNRSGNKFIDYGTGKISIRNTQAVEVEESSVNRFINRLITGFKWYSDNNQLKDGLINTEDVLDFVNTKSPSEEEDDVDIDTYTMKDIERINASIDVDINIPSLISTKTGIDLLHSLLNYNIFNIKAKVDKKAVKDDAKSDEHFMPVYAKLVNNKSLIIK